MSDLLKSLGFREARLPSLYSDFRPQKTSNPDGYNANCGVWLDALCKAARDGRLSSEPHQTDALCIQTGAWLLQALETKQWGRPLALGAVIDEGLSQRRLIPYDEFTTAKKSMYDRSWDLNPRWLLSWALGQLSLSKSKSYNEKLPSGRFVAFDNVEDVAKIAQAKLKLGSTLIDNIYPMASFTSLVTDALNLDKPASASDLTILLTYLSRDKNVIRYNSSVVVFKEDNDQSTEVSQEEATIASLKQSISDLHLRNDLLSSSILLLSEKAKQAVVQKNKAVALSALRSRNLKTQTLDQRTELLTQLEGTLSSIEQAHDQLSMVRLMKDSTNVLKSLHEQVGDVHDVQDITEQLKEEEMKVEEVNEVIQEAGKENSKVDEDEIEQELEKLLEESKSHSTQAEIEELEGLKPPENQLQLPEKLGETTVKPPASAPPTESTALNPVELVG